MFENKLDRRSFVSLSALAAGVGALSVAGCSSETSEASESVLESTTETAQSVAEATPEVTGWLGEAPVIDEADVVETIETEVVIVGGGTGGLFAAATAADEGIKAVVLEKNETGGGVRGDVAAVNSDVQLAADMQMEPADVRAELFRYANGWCSPRVQNVWINQSAEMISFYEKILAAKAPEMSIVNEAGWGVKEPMYTHYPVGHDVIVTEDPNSPTETAEILTEFAEEGGVEFRYETPMIELIKEDDKVVGVYAQGTEGIVRVNASKGVLICTGGYASNQDMIDGLQPEMNKAVSIKITIPGTTGDGIKAALWAGAAMDERHTSMLFNRWGISPESETGMDAKGGMFWMGSQYFMKVSLDGRRFMNEATPYDNVLHASAQLPGNLHCMIWDANWQDQLEAFDTHGCSRLLPFENGAPTNHNIAYIEDQISGLIDGGIVVKADTLEELAEQLGIDVEAFTAEVERYNGFYEKGEDEDFGRLPSTLQPLNQAPFYGVRDSGWLLCTLDGIKINEKMQALSTENEPIEGLYMAGNDSGSFFAGGYPDLFTGLACGRTLTFGRQAIKSIANN